MTTQSHMPGQDRQIRPLAAPLRTAAGITGGAGGFRHGTGCQPPHTAWLYRPILWLARAASRPQGGRYAGRQHRRGAGDA